MECKLIISDDLNWIEYSKQLTISIRDIVLICFDNSLEIEFYTTKPLTFLKILRNCLTHEDM